MDHQHLLGTCKKCRFSDPTADLLSQKLWRRSPAVDALIAQVMLTQAKVWEPRGQGLTKTNRESSYYLAYCSACPLAFAFYWDPTILGSWAPSVTQSTSRSCESFSDKEREGRSLESCFLSKEAPLLLSDLYRDLPRPAGLPPCLYRPQQAQYFISATWSPLHSHGTQCSRLPGRRSPGVEPAPSICSNLTRSLLIPSAGRVLWSECHRMRVAGIATKNKTWTL